MGKYKAGMDYGDRVNLVNLAPLRGDRVNLGPLRGDRVNLAPLRKVERRG